MIIIKTPAEIEKIKAACAITAEVFDQVAPYIKPGVSTWELDQVVYQTIVQKGARPSFLHYGDPPFPGSACISVNEEVVHGIPSKKRILQEGDIVSVDVGAYLDGFHSDAARTFLCGQVDPAVEKLVRVTEEAFWLGIGQAQLGKRIGDISHAIQEHCESQGFGIVRELSGHGLGRNLHEDPEILNYGPAGKGPRLQVGMVLAIEPMVTLGSPRIAIEDDDWTIVTRDGKAAAHYENTIVISEDGPEVLTCPERRRL
ncbi:MAG: type I methionyl aminopeptidase [Eubacteriales bacterium]|nr:type I methionyl aminopeptidase [Eubacteriales bacterium]